MKLIFTIFLCFLLISACAQGRRHFLIGFIGNSKETGVLFDGGYDTAMVEYPNFLTFRTFFEKHFDLKDVRILSVSEISEKDYRTFCKGIKLHN